jgi:hypothetical protein
MCERRAVRRLVEEQRLQSESSSLNRYLIPQSLSRPPRAHLHYMSLEQRVKGLEEEKRYLLSELSLEKENLRQTLDQLEAEKRKGLAARWWRDLAETPLCSM